MAHKRLFFLQPGVADSPVNQAGVRYYSELVRDDPRTLAHHEVDALLEAGITPFVTIFHWDHPLVLEDLYGGFESEIDIVRDFVSYAEVLFDRLGDRVQNWITINEVGYLVKRVQSGRRAHD